MTDIENKKTGRIREFSEEIREPIEQRIKNPFVASFFISFLLINWRPILYFVLSSVPVEAKINHIDHVYYGELTINLLYFILWPLIAASIYSFAIPWVVEFIEWNKSFHFKRKDQRTHTRLRQKYIDRVEYAKETKKYEDERSGYLSVQETNEKMELFQSAIDERDGIIDSYKAEIEKIRSGHDEIVLRFQEESEKDKARIDFLDHHFSEKSEEIMVYRGETERLQQEIEELKSQNDELSRYRIELEEKYLELENSKNQEIQLLKKTITPEKGSR